MTVPLELESNYCATGSTRDCPPLGGNVVLSGIDDGAVEVVGHLLHVLEGCSVATMQVMASYGNRISVFEFTFHW